MKKQISAILYAVILTALAVSACGNAGVESYDQVMDDGGVDVSENTAMKADMLEMASEESGAGIPGAENSAVGGDVKNQNQKLIFTYNYSVETKEFDSFYEKVNQKVTQTGGYIEHFETSGSAADGINRHANLTLRIPAGQMEQMLELLDSDSNVTYQSRSSEDVTLQYVDMESHLKALRTEQETLLELMEKADKLKDVIALQSQLTQVRYEIESYESQLRTYDNLVDYSTLYLDIMEVDRTTNIHSSKTSFFQEIGNRFSDNAYALGQWLRAMAVWLISSLPILVPLALAGAAAVLFIRKKFRRRKKETQETQETQEIRKP